MEKTSQPKANWTDYDSTVQAYRSNFLASQSFFLAVGAILLGKSSILLYVVAGLAIVSIWYVWHRIILIRARIADYCKFEMEERFNNKGVYTEKRVEDSLKEETYLKNREVRRNVYSEMTKLWGKKFIRMIRKINDSKRIGLLGSS